MARDFDPELSVVIPCLNEEEAITATYSKVKSCLKEASSSWELIFIDDGSTDQTWSILQGFSAKDSRVHAVKLSRNFGHQRAIGAGLECSKGRAVIVMDADLQDPPEVIGEMLAKWKAGALVVYGQRTKRHEEPLLKRFFAKLFYRTMTFFAEAPTPEDSGDFALMDRRVVDILMAMNEPFPFWRGLRGWVGFKHDKVLFAREARTLGEPKYNFTHSFNLAFEALLSSSLKFYRIVALMACVLAIFVLTSIVVSILFFDMNLEQRLFQSLQFAGGIISCFVLILVALLIELGGRLFLSNRQRPRWIVEKSTIRGGVTSATEITVGKAG